MAKEHEIRVRINGPDANICPHGQPWTQCLAVACAELVAWVQAEPMFHPRLQAPAIVAIGCLKFRTYVGRTPRLCVRCEGAAPFVEVSGDLRGCVWYGPIDPPIDSDKRGPFLLPFPCDLKCGCEFWLTWARPRRPI